MGRPAANLIGREFGRLTVIERAGTDGYSSLWRCRCSCTAGKVIIVSNSNLRKGSTSSCGCLQRETARLQKTRHGKRNERIYTIWRAIKQRCYDASRPEYPNYGGRGIVMDPQWKESFEAFYADVGDPPTERHTLDRRDNDGPYTKINCHWRTMKEQQNNRRNNLPHLTYNGRTMSITEWAKELGVNVGTLRTRYHAGWTTEEILNGVPRKRV